LNNAAFVATRVFQNNRLGVEGGGLVTRDTMFKLTIKRAGIREIEPDVHQTSGSGILRAYDASLGGILDMAYSARAVMVRLGLTPGLAGMIEPSTMYSPG
jgi:hypothetical protein